MSIIRIALACCCLLALLPGVERTGGVVNNLAGGLAVGGYDVVAYFDQDAAVPGSADHTYDYAGATWRFASAANLKVFRQDPRRYAPQFGGFCAFGCSVDALFQVDPVDGWLIHNGKLYLNLNRDIRDLFSQDIEANIAKAEQHWPRLDR